MLLNFVESPIEAPTKEKRNCLGCGKEFEVNGSKYDHRQTYCELKCRYKAKATRLGMDLQPKDYDNKNRGQNVTIGAAAELLVCTELLRLGLNVYRSVSPAARFDLIATNDNGAIWRIEVKRAVKTVNERFITIGHGIVSNFKHLVEVWAFVILESKEIFYFLEPRSMQKPENSIKFWEIRSPHHELEKENFVEKGYLEGE